MRPAVHVAQEVGAGLGSGPLLQRPLPQRRGQGVSASTNGHAPHANGVSHAYGAPGPAPGPRGYERLELLRAVDERNAARVPA